MEEKREDLLKNLKKINAIYGELDDLRAKVKEAKSSVYAINKKISAKEKSLRAEREAALKAEREELTTVEPSVAEAETPHATEVPSETEVKEVKPANEQAKAAEKENKETVTAAKITSKKSAKESAKEDAQETASDADVNSEAEKKADAAAKSEIENATETKVEKPAATEEKPAATEEKPAEKPAEKVEEKSAVKPVMDEKAIKEARKKALEEAQARALAEARAKILEQKKKEAIARGEDPSLVKLASEKPRVYEPPKRERPLKREYVPQDGRRPGGANPRTPSDRPFGQRSPMQKPGGFGGAKKAVEISYVPKDTGKSFGNKKKSSEKSYDDKKGINKKSLAKGQVSIDDFDENKSGYRKARNKKDKKAEEQTQTIKIEKAVINKEIIPIKELSEKLGISAIEITKKLFKEGIMKTINDSVDYDTAGVIAADLGIELELKMDKTAEEVLSETFDTADDAANLVKRPPVVTVMGHVDHGKTSLLDRIRSANVTASEAGGITQHIGAYTVSVNGEKITFLDTPGHAAFTAMRARGAQITDIAVLVVAADDGIMPQTIEAIHHAQAAGVSIIVAANKIDKPQANIERVKQQLADQSVLIEEWGGDVAFVPVSAKTGEGVDDLLETILLTADVKELKANPNRMAKGTIIEAKLDKGKGPVATVLIQNGTLHTGDNLVAGTITGRVRAMIDDKGRNVKEAGPSMAVSILGLEEVPNAGDSIYAVEQDKLSKLVAQERRNKEREEMIKQSQKITLDDLFSKISDGNLKALNILIKADVQGSVEAVKQSLLELSNEEVKVNVIHAAVGAINETDVMLADSSNAIIIGFNVRPDSNAKTLAERSKVDIRLYRIIYEAIDDVKNAMKGLIAPKTQEIYMGKAEVRQTFKITGVGMVAGCYVTEGKIIRHGKLRIYRNDVMICEGNVNQLKRFKDDVKEVSQGFECGISIENFNDIQIGDFIESYLIEIKPVV
ncbi:MAG: translation initiation factor IF-2 [Clostridia bacterium]|nr:translation initiation factor IF-2 [Clostridia bacterium]